MGTRRVVAVIGHSAPLVSMLIQGSGFFDILPIALISFTLFVVGCDAHFTGGNFRAAENDLDLTFRVGP